MSAATTADDWGMLGNSWAVDLLRTQVQKGSVRHAYLLTGPRGVGRRTLALRFIQALECPSPSSPGVPCRTCRICRQIERMEYPDLSVVKAEKTGGSLSVEQVREVRRLLASTPLQGAHRFALFLRFEEATPNAANALLKTLEEAPSHAILVLTASSSELLLPTILSRCELLALQPSPLADLTALLSKQGVPPDLSALLAHLSGGRTGIALALSADPDLLTQRQEYLDELTSILRADRLEKFARADKLTREKDHAALRARLAGMFETWLTYARDCLVAASGAETPLINIDRAEEIRLLAGRLGIQTARRMTSRLEKALDQLDKNVNTRLLVEVLFLDLPKAA